jgi:hypothetical protein
MNITLIIKFQTSSKNLCSKICIDTQINVMKFSIFPKNYWLQFSLKNLRTTFILSIKKFKKNWPSFSNNLENAPLIFKWTNFHSIFILT